MRRQSVKTDWMGGFHMGVLARVTVLSRMGHTTSSYLLDDYFPVIATIEKGQDYVHFVGLHHNDDLAELQVDPESSRILQVTVTAAHHFASHDGRLAVPAAGEGIVAVGPPGHVDCEGLGLDVYDDGIAIDLSTTPAARHVRMGDVVFGVAADGELADILLTRMSPKEVVHARVRLAEDLAQGVWVHPSA